MRLFLANKDNTDWRTEVPNDFVSLNWTERAYEYGQFELKLYSNQSVAKYPVYNYFVRDDTRTVMVIETVSIKQEADGVYLHTYTGRSLESMYTWRVNFHRNWIEPDSTGKFYAQKTAAILADRVFGTAAAANRRLPNFNFHMDNAVSEMAYLNDTGKDLQDGKWVIYDRGPVADMFKDVIAACKPNGYSLFYRCTLESNHSYHTYIEHPRLIETVTLSEENDNFSSFESVQSIVDAKSTIYEVFDTGDVDMEWVADNTTHSREHTLRTEAPVTRREVIWDNTQVHKPYSVDDWNKLTELQKKHIQSLSEVWYPFWVLDSMFPKYTPLRLVSGKIDNFSGIEYRKGFDVGDVMYYMPTGGDGNPIEAQLTEMTESWSQDGFSQTPSISMASRNKWNGDGFRIDFTREGPGAVIVPRDR